MVGVSAWTLACWVGGAVTILRCCWHMDAACMGYGSSPGWNKGRGMLFRLGIIWLGFCKGYPVETVWPHKQRECERLDNAERTSGPRLGGQRSVSGMPAWQHSDAVSGTMDKVV